MKIRSLKLTFSIRIYGLYFLQSFYNATLEYSTKTAVNSEEMWSAGYLRDRRARARKASNLAEEKEEEEEGATLRK